MPRFYFHLVSGDERVLDMHGVDLCDEQLISRATLASIQELRREEPDLFDGRQGWSLEIVDANGRLVDVMRL